MKSSSSIGDEMPRDGREWEGRCARCGTEALSDICDGCGGDGVRGHDCGEDSCCCLSPEDNITCDICGGTGVVYLCGAAEDWCRANPMPGRGDRARSVIEWRAIIRVYEDETL